jgi:hypothetical protein
MPVTDVVGGLRFGQRPVDALSAADDETDDAARVASSAKAATTDARAVRRLTH